MTYDISLVRPEPGLTALQTLEWQSAQFDLEAFELEGPALLHLSEHDVAGWRRVCEQVASWGYETQQESFPSYVGVALVDPRVRVEFSGVSGSIAIPFWYVGDAAARALRVAYEIGRLMEREFGFVGVDGQTEAGLDVVHLTEAVALYLGTRGAALRAISERE
ncbi:hypothetical protein LG324_13515 [Phycicoccus jejuensis]|uniref:hypothetical protein n=1 Tax=Phycicoccus jejuensis TaxID=367299 RepID=UPI00384F0FFD